MPTAGIGICRQAVFGDRFARRPGVGIREDMAPWLSCHGRKFAGLPEQHGIIFHIPLGSLRVHIIEEINAVGAAIKHGTGSATHGLQAVHDRSAILQVRTHQHFETGSQYDFRTLQLSFPLFDGDVEFDRGPEGTGHQHVDEAFLSPAYAVQSQAHCRMRARWNPGAQKDPVAAPLFPTAEQ